MRIVLFLVLAALAGSATPAVAAAKRPVKKAPSTIATPVPLPAPPAPPAPSAPPARARVAVMRTLVDGVADGVGAQLTARVAQAVGARTGDEVISAEEIDALIAHERDKQLVGCTQQSCLSEVADALGADTIVQARLTKVEGGYALSVTALDSKQAKIVARVDENWGGEPLLLLDVAAPAVDRLFPDRGPRAEGTITLDGAKDGSRIVVDDVVRGTAPAGQLSLPAGAHRLGVTLEGHEPFAAWIIVPTGSAQAVPVSQLPIETPAFYQTWWFWTAVGGGAAVAVAGGVAAVALAGGGGAGSKTGVLVELNADDVLQGKR